MKFIESENIKISPSVARDIFQVFNSRIWLVTTTLDSTDIENPYPLQTVTLSSTALDLTTHL